MKTHTSRRHFLRLAGLGAGAALLGGCASSPPAPAKPPNIVLIFLDDSGYADFRPFGKTNYPTPHVERLATQGCTFTNFHVPQAVCSASRAALMTGCFPGRTKMFGAHPPRAAGLDPNWATLGEVLQQAGYATGFFGKWHLGDQNGRRPQDRGFDSACGLMYSNDMWRHHPGTRHFDKWPLQYWENGTIKIEDVSPKQQKMLTTWSTNYAVDFIDKHKDQPFFVYVPHSMPHVPLFCSDKFEGKSGKGLYADVMMEIDWSVGEIMKALKTADVEDNTLVIFSSDNGPWISYGNHAGKTPFREAKGTSFDGGTRSACLMKLPGHIKAGSKSNRLFGSVDLLPTICRLTGATLPRNQIDGMNQWDLITGERGMNNPQPYYAFSNGNKFEGIMTGDGKWRLHVPHGYRYLVKAGNDGKPGQYGRKNIKLSLFDMENDPYETTNVINKYPDVATKLTKLAETHRKDFYGR